MKKLFTQPSWLLTLTLLFLIGFQKFNAQNNITLATDPTKTMGYTYWEPVSGASSYEVKTFAPSVNEENLLLSTSLTQSNFFQFDPLFLMVPGANFEINALNTNGTVIGSSDNIDCVSVGWLAADWLCYEHCNGVSYAYRITSYQSYQWLADGTIGPDEIYLEVSNAPHYQNPNIALQIPYWQAISATAWLNLQVNYSSHPYVNAALSPSGPYYTMPISNAPNSGPFYDISNTPVVEANSILIEKKMDQFQHFGTASTAGSGLLLGSTVCGMPFNGVGNTWVNYINSNGLSNVTMPTAPNAFTGTIVTALECNPSINGSVYDTNTGQYDGYWGEWLSEVYDELFIVDDLLDGMGTTINWENLTELVEGLGDIDLGAVGGEIVGVSINSLNLDENRIVEFVKYDLGESLRLKEANKELSPGLYGMYIYTSTGEALPFFFEINAEIPIPDDKDFVEVEIAPNPVQGNDLTLFFNSTKELNSNIFVHNMYGEILFSDSYVISDGANDMVHFDLSDKSTPLNQVIVTVIFPDGSVIQKNALTL